MEEEESGCLLCLKILEGRVKSIYERSLSSVAKKSLISKNESKGWLMIYPLELLLPSCKRILFIQAQDVLLHCGNMLHRQVAKKNKCAVFFFFIFLE